MIASQVVLKKKLTEITKGLKNKHQVLNPATLGCCLCDSLHVWSSCFPASNTQLVLGLSEKLMVFYAGNNKKDLKLRHQSHALPGLFAELENRWLHSLSRTKSKDGKFKVIIFVRVHRHLHGCKVLACLWFSDALSSCEIEDICCLPASRLWAPKLASKNCLLEVLPCTSAGPVHCAWKQNSWEDKYGRRGPP